MGVDLSFIMILNAAPVGKHTKKYLFAVLPEMLYRNIPSGREGVYPVVDRAK